MHLLTVEEDSDITKCNERVSLLTQLPDPKAAQSEYVLEMWALHLKRATLLSPAPIMDKHVSAHSNKTNYQKGL